MKKMILLLLNFLTIFTLFSVQRYVFYCFKNSSVEETNTPIVNNLNSSSYTNEFMSKTKNFSLNSLGSCGYQAINILLNYYDSFWNDSIIPENYEKKGDVNSNLEIINSPGSIYNDIQEQEVSSSHDYYNKLDNNNIMKTLISIGVEKNYTYLSEETKEDFGLYANQIFDILKTYMNTYVNSNDFYFYENHYSSGLMNSFSKARRTEIIKYVKAGIPVLVSAQNNKYGHAFIAYDYDETNDIIYAHYGYKNSKTHHNFELDYQTINGICALVPKSSSSHNHSDNFIYNQSNFCSCNLKSHNHVLQYTYNFNTHIASCYCGYNYEENHIVNKKKNCIYCNTCIDPNDRFQALLSLGGA